nr:YceI family protein [uncultured Carboxylicivirga sp.]
MKLSSLLLVFTLLVSAAAFAQSKKIDVKKSSLEWTGKKVTGEHMGNILFKSGELVFKDGKLSGGEFEVDMTSITNTDLTDAEYNKKLVGHLKSDDFFGVEKYPTSTLKIKTIHQKGNEYHVVADLTIKGKTNPVEFSVMDSDDVYDGVITIDRTKYDVRYGSGKFFDNLGDKVIYDEFTLAFKVVTL